MSAASSWDNPPPILSWESDSEGRRTWSSLQWAEFTGQDRRGSDGLGWLDAIHPDDQEMSRNAWRSAVKPVQHYVDHRIRAANGGHAWFRSGFVHEGTSSGISATRLGTSTAIDDLKLTLSQQQAVLTALQHRVRNTLGTVRSIVRLGVSGDEAASEYAAILDGRIGAMARVQAGLIRNPLIGADLAQLVVDEFAALAVQEGPQLAIHGPAIRLLGRATETLGMAFHEMVTNAMRHGPLATDRGHVDVSWRRIAAGGEDYLLFEWRESGLTDHPPLPLQGGFGTKVLTELLVHQLRAETVIRLAADGLHIAITLPLAGNTVPTDPVL